MIKADKGELTMMGPDFVLGVDLLCIIDGVVDAQEKTGVNICKKAFECASDLGDIPKLIKFAELMRQAPEQ